MTEDVLNIDVEEAKGNPRAASVRVQAKSRSKAYAQRRHDFRIGKQPNYVDPNRTYLNRVLVEPRPLPEIRDEVEDLRRRLGGKRRAMKSNAALVTAGLISFGTEAQEFFGALSAEAQDAALLDLARALADLLETRLTALVVHLDEAALHAHFEMRGYNDHGQPLSKFVNRTKSSELQDLVHEVMQRHCPRIERGHKKWDRLAAGADYADTVHRSVRQLHHDLPFEIAAKQKELADLRARSEVLRASAAKDAARLAKLREKEELTAKEEKRLATYQARLAKKEAELDRLEADLAERASTTDGREAELEESERAVADREAEVTRREADLAAREDAQESQARDLAAREDRLAEEQKRQADAAAQQRADVKATQDQFDERERVLAPRERMALILERGVEMLGDGWIEYRPAEGDRTEGLRLGKGAPDDDRTRRRIGAVAKAARPALLVLGRATWRTVKKIVGRERARIAEDAAELAAIREEMGLGPHETLESIRRRNDDERPGW